jgi:hypothetical protein
MAGDWIKVELTLPEKPEVIAVAAHLGITEDEVVGKLIRFWRWCDQQLSSCHAPGVTLLFIDRYIGAQGFARAMVNVGWLVEKKDGLEIAKFDRHLSQGSKVRALAADRKRHARVPIMSRAHRDKSVTREEKRRIQEPPPTPSPIAASVSASPEGGGGGSDGWEEAERRLRKLDMGDVRGAVDGAKALGMTPKSVSAAVDEWQASGGAWNIGALHWRLTHGTWPERSSNGQEEKVAAQEKARTRRLLGELGKRPQIDSSELTLKEQLARALQPTEDVT